MQLNENQTEPKSIRITTMKRKHTHQPKQNAPKNILPVFSSNVFVVLGRLIMIISSLSTNGIYGRVPSPIFIYITKYRNPSLN